MTLADVYHLYVVEDNAQSVGADYIFSDGRGTKGRDDRTYRDDIFFSIQAVSLLWRWGGVDDFRRGVGYPYPA